jgi:hypothetical protein
VETVKIILQRQLHTLLQKIYLRADILEISY